MDSDIKNLRIVPVGKQNVTCTARLFEQLAGDPQFHPHPMTVAHAQWLAHHTGQRDVYLVALWGESAVAYGILRGWDDGFDVPSLGVAVDACFRGCGIGRMMMEALHTIARLRGATKIRLKVYQTNKHAEALYASLGYEWTGIEEGQLVGYRQLNRQTRTSS